MTNTIGYGIMKMFQERNEKYKACKYHAERGFIMLKITVENATAAKIKAEAKAAVLEEIKAGRWNELGVEYVGPVPYAPVQVNNTIECWVELKLTTKQWTDTKVSSAFDPFAAAAEYEEEMRIKAEEAEAARKAREEAARLRKSKNSRKKTKTNTEE